MRRLLWILLALAVVGAAVWLPGFHRQADMGAGFLAKQMCSCVFVGERSLASCRPDMLHAMDRIEVEPLAEDHGMRASIPLLTERIARYEPGFGCTLEP